MDSNVSGKDGQGASHEGDRTIGMATGSSPVHVAETAFKSCQKATLTLAASQPCQVVCDSRQSKRARAALTGTLIGEVASDAGGLSEAAGRFAECHDHADSSRGADGAERDGCIGGHEMLRAKPRSPVSPDEERLYPLNGLATLSDVPQRGALVNLDDSGMSQGTTQCHETGTGFLGDSASPKRPSPVASDESDVGQRLGVVHESRALLHAKWYAFVRTEDGSRAR
jgi:hypothetical protein